MSAKTLFPNATVVLTEYFDAHQDWEVPIPGFLIVAARQQKKSIADFTDEETQEFIKLIVGLRKGMKEVLRIEEVYLFQNEDSAHGFHLWLFPRFKWMEQFGKKIESVRPIINYAKENMDNQAVKTEVLNMVQSMKEYMRKGF